MRTPGPGDVGVVELRQYTLRPGRRDDLVAVFDGELVETQEALGGYVLGQFLDLEHDDRFVWLRGFADLAARLRMLTAFYGGAVWAEHGPAANETMLDSDDVLLLQPVLLGDVVADHRRPVREGPSARCTGWVLHHDGPVPPAVVEDLAAGWQDAVAQAGAEPVAVLRTLDVVNDFPRLPVRAEHVVVLLARAPEPVAAPRPARWREARPPQRLLLAPTARSALR